MGSSPSKGYEWSFNHFFSADHAGCHKVVIFLNPGDLLPLIPYCYGEKNPEYMPPTTLLVELRK